jgi:hypothetical protein
MGTVLCEVYVGQKLKTGSDNKYSEEGTCKSDVKIATPTNIFGHTNSVIYINFL